MSTKAWVVYHLIFNGHRCVSKEIKANLFTETTMSTENKTANGLGLRVRSRFKFSALVSKIWNSNPERPLTSIGRFIYRNKHLRIYVNQLWLKALVYVLYWQVRQNTVLFGSSLIIKPGPPFVNWLSQCYLSLDHTIALNCTIGKIDNWYFIITAIGHIEVVRNSKLMILRGSSLGYWFVIWWFKKKGPILIM